MFEISNTKVPNDFWTVGRIDYVVIRYDFKIKFAVLNTEREVWRVNHTEHVGDSV